MYLRGCSSSIDLFSTSSLRLALGGGLVSAGVFAKWIDNPIFDQSLTQQNVEFGGRFYETLEFS